MLDYSSLRFLLCLYVSLQTHISYLCYIMSKLSRYSVSLFMVLICGKKKKGPDHGEGKIRPDL